MVDRLVGLPVLAGFWSVFLVSLLAWSGSPLQAEERWRVSAVPAVLNQDQTVHLVGGRAQPVDLALQAVPEVLPAEGEVVVDLLLALPAGIRLAGLEGALLHRTEPEVHTTADGGQRVTVSLALPSWRIVGAPKQPMASEWQMTTVFLAADGVERLTETSIGLSIRHDGRAYESTWRVVVHPWESRKHEGATRTVFGLWNYNVDRVEGWDRRLGIAFDAQESGSMQVARLLAEAGINFAQRGAGGFHQAARAHGILIGGDVHHAFFDGGEALQDILHDGQSLAGNLASATRINQLPEGAEIPGAQKMVEIARNQDGMATYDYEPMTGVGFTPEAIAEFKRIHGVDDEAFDAFRQAMNQWGPKLYVQGSPEDQAMFRRWVAFQSEESANYVRRISQAVRSIDPDVRIAVTPNPGYDRDGLTTLGFGYDATLFAPHVDVIMPQIYVGYSGGATKLAIEKVDRWHKRMTELQAPSELWPILLVRYAGATVFNSPARVRQQILGAVASGAQGFLLYYPGNMDAPYWQILAATSDEMARWETFYLDGQRVEEQFPLRDMVQGFIEVNRYPAHRLPVENPQWLFRAHEHDSQVLLTLMNLEDANDVLFTVDLPEGWTIDHTEGAEFLDEGRWLVSPQGVGFVKLVR